MKFNQGQLQAIESESHRMMCLASAGAGKTSTLIEKTYRIKNEMGIPYEQILCLTFTRSAGKEMKERIIKKDPDGEKLFANTFHGFGCEMIDMFGHLVGFEKDFTIYDREDEIDILTAIVYDLSLKVKASKYYDFIKGNIDPIEQSKIYKECELLKKEFYNRLREYNAIHLDGILEITKELLCHREVFNYYNEKYRYVFVDENQDTNLIQNEIVDLLQPEYLFVVGDINQAIYKWNGAMPEYFENFPKRHEDVEVVTMTDNYRSTQQIVEFANNLIRKKELDYDVTMTAHKDGPYPEIQRYRTFNDELYSTMLDIIDRYENLSDACVLTRTNKTAALFAEVCEKNDVSYNLVSQDADPLKKEYIRGLFMILRAATNKRDTFTTKQLIKALKLNIPSVDLSQWELESTMTGKSLFNIMLDNGNDDVKKKLSILNRLDVSPVSDIRKTFESLVNELGLEAKWISADLFNRVSILKDVKALINRWALNRMTTGYRKDVNAFLRWLMLKDIREKEEKNKPGINIMTMHTSKGLEFEHVYIIGCNDGIIPSKRGDAIEELNLMYVATTRARENLTISYSNEITLRYNDNGPSHTKTLNPSPYIDYMINLSLF